MQKYELDVKITTTRRLVVESPNRRKLDSWIQNNIGDLYEEGESYCLYNEYDDIDLGVTLKSDEECDGKDFAVIVKEIV